MKSSRGGYVMKRKRLVMLSLLMVGSLMASMPVYAEEGEANPVIPEEEQQK